MLSLLVRSRTKTQQTITTQTGQCCWERPHLPKFTGRCDDVAILTNDDCLWQTAWVASSERAAEGLLLFARAPLNQIENNHQLRKTMRVNKIKIIKVCTKIRRNVGAHDFLTRALIAVKVIFRGNPLLLTLKWRL